MTRLLFGTGGIPFSTAKPKNLLNGIKRIAELGLGCTEMEFVYGVRMTEADAAQVATTAQKYRVKLTAHAPYYINLNSPENDKLVASQSVCCKPLTSPRFAGLTISPFTPLFTCKTCRQRSIPD